MSTTETPSHPAPAAQPPPARKFLAIARSVLATIIRALQTNPLLGVGLFLVFVALFPLVIGAVFPAQSNVILNIAVQVSIYALAALGLNIIVGYCGLLNLGFAGFMLIGAYTAGILMKEYHFSFWAASAIAVAHGVLWGVILGLPTLRLTGDYFAIVTFGFSELVIMFTRNWTALTNGTGGYPGVPRPRIGTYQFTVDTRAAYWYLAAGMLALGLLVSARLLRSRLGRAWVALREDEVAAEACGINAMWYKTVAFAISAGFGAMSGALLATYSSLADFRNFDFMTSVFVLCYLVLGGMGTVVGPFLGAAVLFTLSELLRENPIAMLSRGLSWWPAASDWLRTVPWSPDMRFILFGVLLIVVIRFRPEGLIPNRVRARELHAHGLTGEPDHESLYELRSRT